MNTEEEMAEITAKYLTNPELIEYQIFNGLGWWTLKDHSEYGDGEDLRAYPFNFNKFEYRIIQPPAPPKMRPMRVDEFTVGKTLAKFQDSGGDGIWLLTGIYKNDLYFYGVSYNIEILIVLKVLWSEDGYQWNKFEQPE